MQLSILLAHQFLTVTMTTEACNTAAREENGEHAPAERSEVTQPVGSKNGKMFSRERGENRKPQ